MQFTIAALDFGKQLFMVVLHSVRHAHYLLGVADKVEESSSWKHVVLIEIEDEASKKFGLQIFWTLKIKEFLVHL